jgi:uncharacterized protein (TIGR02391 family)
MATVNKCLTDISIMTKGPGVDMTDRDEMLTRLAEEAAALVDVPYKSPKVDLWKRRTREFVSREFGDDYVTILNRVLFFNRVVMSEGQGQGMHRGAMEKAVTFLTELRSEASPVPPSEEPPAPPFLRLEDLHPAIVDGCAELYAAGHLAEAVEKSFKIVRERLRQLTGYETGSEAFGKGGLRVQGVVEPWVDDNFNEAVRFLTMAIDRFRNEKAHTADARIAEATRAAEYLAMSSLAMRLLDAGYIRRDA